MQERMLRGERDPWMPLEVESKERSILPETERASTAFSAERNIERSQGGHCYVSIRWYEQSAFTKDNAE
jgi:hypothetical protein